MNPVSEMNGKTSVEESIKTKQPNSETPDIRKANNHEAPKKSTTDVADTPGKVNKMPKQKASQVNMRDAQAVCSHQNLLPHIQIFP